MRLDPVTRVVLICVAFATSVAAAVLGLQIVLQLFIWLG